MVAVRKDSKPPNVSRAQSLMLPPPSPFASPPARRPRPQVGGKTGGSGARRLPRQNLDVKRFPQQNVRSQPPDNTRLSPGQKHRCHPVRSHRSSGSRTVLGFSVTVFRLAGSFHPVPTVEEL